MEKQKSLKINVMMSVILTASNFIFPLITYSYVARILTPVGTGKVAFVNSILQYFSYIAILGIPSYGLRECAKVRNDKKKLSHIVQELLIISLTATVISYIILILCIFIIPKLHEYKELFAVMGIYILLNTIGLEWVYQALEEYKYITIRSLIFKCASVVLTFLLIKSSDDFIWYGFLSIFTISASYICNFINIHKYIDMKKAEKYNFKRHMKPILTLFFASIVTTIYANFDTSMIGFISTENEVGLYNAAVKIKFLILSISTAITSSLIPRISYYIEKKEKSNINKIIITSMRISLLLAIPVAIYIFIFAENVLEFVCGIGYLEAAPTLRILIIAVIPLALNNLFGNQLLIPMGLEKRYSQSVFVGLWINLFLNFILIPFYGAFGAAIGTLATEIWNTFWMSSGVKEYRNMLLKEIKWHMYILGMLLSGLISIILCKLINNVSVIYQLTFTAIAFFGLYYIYILIMKEPLLIEEINKIKGKIINYHK